MLPIAAATLALLLAAAQTPAPPSEEAFMKGGVWQPNEKVSPLDGSRTVTWTILSTTTVRNVIGAQVPAVLMLKCSGRDLSALISWPGAFMGNSLVPISWRIQEQPVQREVWQPVQGLPGAAQNFGARRFLDAVQESGRLVMQVSTYSSTQDVIFEIPDGATAVQSVRAACQK